MYGIHVTSREENTKAEENKERFESFKEAYNKLAAKYETKALDHFFVIKEEMNIFVVLMNFLKELQSIKDFDFFIELLHVMRITDIEPLSISQLKKSFVR